MTHYLYCITNKNNNKSYVGQTVNVEDRWKNHIYDAKRMEGKSAAVRKSAFQNAIAKYGEDDFVWQVIDECETIEEANDLEEFYIAYLCTLAPFGYNILPGGNNRRIHESSKKKISETLKKTSSFIGKKGKDHPNFGRKLTKERKEHLSKIRSGDNGPGKKITSKIAREIYLEYLNNDNLTSMDLVRKYGLKKGAILNILSKWCWKDATKDLPDIIMKKGQNRNKRPRKAS